jgi:hypothetical protein
MKTKVYLRIAKGSKGSRVSASPKPCYEPIRNAKSYTSDSDKALPTVAFALELDIPDDLFKQAEQVAAQINLTKKGATVCGTVISVEKP